MISIQNQNIDFWFTHLQMEYEAHIWRFRRAHEYCSYTKYGGLTPNRNRFINDLVFWVYNGVLLYRPVQDKESRFWPSSGPRGPLYEFLKWRNSLQIFFTIKYFTNSLWENYVLYIILAWEKYEPIFYIFLQRMSDGWQPPIWSWRCVLSSTQTYLRW